MKYNLVVLMCLVEGTISPMNSLSEGWLTKEVCMALFFIGIAFRVKVGGIEVCVCCDGCVCCGLLSEDALSCWVSSCYIWHLSLVGVLLVFRFLFGSAWSNDCSKRRAAIVAVRSSNFSISSNSRSRWDSHDFLKCLHLLDYFILFIHSLLKFI